MNATHPHRRWPWLLASVAVLVVVVLAALAWWLPASWAWRWMRADYPAVRAGAVAGTLWHGEMHDLVVGGQPLGTLRWTLGRAAMFGRVHGTIDLRGAAVVANARFERLGADTLRILDAHADISLAGLHAFVPVAARVDGRLQATIVDARLVAGWPTRLDASVRWNDAAVVDDGQRIVLGDLQSRWHAAGGTVVTAQLEDAGTGPIALHGTFTATPLGWRLDAALTPRTDAAGLHRWLERVGQPMPDGGVEVERRGGLMMGPMP